jgi:hypothetical protein
MTEAPLPTPHQLRAACQLALVLDHPETALPDARVSFSRLPSNGALRSRDFGSGERILASVGLLRREDQVLHVDESIVELAAVARSAGPDLLLSLILERNPPAWLPTAAGGNQLKAAAVPDRELASLDHLIANEQLRDAVLRQAARRQDAILLADLDQLGEEHVVECCREQLQQAQAVELAAEVVRAARISRRLPYSVVAPKLDGRRRLLVKTTRRLQWRSEIFLSRREFEIGRADPDWSLVVVELDDTDAPKIVGWCDAAALEPMVPTDTHPHAIWSSVSLLLSAPLLNTGLPAFQ